MEELAVYVQQFEAYVKTTYFISTAILGVIVAFVGAVWSE